MYMKRCEVTISNSISNSISITISNNISNSSKVTIDASTINATDANTIGVI